MFSSLVAYDYGVGGLWAIVDANSEDEIVSKYPELGIAHERPKWMSPAHYEDILANRHYDIQDEPAGVLAVVVSDRLKRQHRGA
jgi:hypothetical protein